MNWEVFLFIFWWKALILPEMRNGLQRQLECVDNVHKGVPLGPVHGVLEGTGCKV